MNRTYILDLASGGGICQIRQAGDVVGSSV